MGNNRNNITKSLSIRSKNSNVSNLINSVNDSQFSKGSYRDKFRISQKSYLTEANKIMNERMKNKGNTINAKHRMRGLVMNDTRDICLKNYLIGLLKESRTDLNEKEKDITKALRDGETRLETDYRNFIEFVENTKKKQKKEEEELTKFKSLHEEKDNLYKKMIIDNKKLYDELEKTVKLICLLKSYGSFVHKVLNIDFELDKINTYIDPRERNFEVVANTLLNKFDTIINSNKEIEELLEDDHFMMMKFNDNEIKVMKELEKKVNQENKIENYEDEIRELKRRYDDCYNEVQNYELEKKNIINSINKLKPEKNSDVNQYLDYIVELGMATGDLNNKLKGKKNFMDLLNFTKETLNVIQKKELQVNEYIAEIEDIEENGDKQLIHDVEYDRKKTNKKEKQLLIKQKQDEIENLKRQRAIDRAQRVIIVGRKVPKEYPIIKGKKKKNNENKNNVMDDYGMLYYSSDED